ncbi:MAG: hypothetical protein R3316_00585 [Rhodovibrionaceae bacterium]|nr:hypothetical protein [Rhodovibrionaceae bacterium]
MSLHPHEKRALRFLGIHLAGGSLGAALFGGLILWFDLFGIRTMAGESDLGWLAVALLFFGLVITFGSVAMGIGVMREGSDER